MNNGYFIAEIKRGSQHRIFLFEVEGRETLEEVVAKNFGEEAKILKYRIPTPEELILMRRGMKT